MTILITTINAITIQDIDTLAITNTLYIYIGRDYMRHSSTGQNGVSHNYALYIVIALYSHAYTVMAYIGMAYMLMVWYIVTAYMPMVWYIVMAYMLMASFGDTRAKVRTRTHARTDGCTQDG